MRRAVAMGASPRALAWLAATFLAAGCGIPLDAPLGHSVVNTCSSASDCSSDAACTQGKCVATRYDLANLLLQVRPHADATFGAGTAYVIDPGASIQLVSRGGGLPFLTRFDMKLSAPVAIKGGKVLLDPSTVPGKDCNFPDGSVPAQLTFHRVPKLAGLPFDPVQVGTQATADAAGTTYSFDIDLVADPGDRYDVYIEPQIAPGCSMSIPPYYLPDQTIDANSTVWHLPPFGTLTGTINGLTDTSAWHIDLVEPTRGLPISAGNHLDLAVGSKGATMTAQIPPIDAGSWPILRLTPVIASKPEPRPIDPTRPSVYWALKGAVIGGTKADPQVEFTVGDLVVTPVDVMGRVLGSDGLSGIATRMTLQSQTLQGANAGNAAFSTNAVQSDASGAFTVGLPPGDYSVRIFPIADSGLSITDRQLHWPANTPTPSCVCGVAFELDSKAALNGAITAPDGHPLIAATVGITPSQPAASSYLASTHMLGSLPSRVETTATDAAGSFALLADLGTCDLTVQPDPATNLPWLVIPQISPEPGAAPSKLALSSPAFLGGIVLDPQGNPVANAQIDAWYPVRSATNPAVPTGIVVKIATASTDAGGAYTLVLPSSIPSNGLK